MEAVAPHAVRGQFARQGELLGECRLAAMEGGVEAGDLRQVRGCFQNRRDGRQIVRLVQWRERHELPELGEDGCVDPRRRGVGGSAMYDAVAERQHVPAGQQLAPCGHDLVGSAMVIEHAVPPVLFGDERAVCLECLKAGAGADAFDLAVEEFRAVVMGIVDRELDARRAGVEDGNAAGLVHALFLRRRCWCRHRHRPYRRSRAARREWRDRRRYSPRP